MRRTVRAKAVARRRKPIVIPPVLHQGLLNEPVSTVGINALPPPASVRLSSVPAGAGVPFSKDSFCRGQCSLRCSEALRRSSHRFREHLCYAEPAGAHAGGCPPQRSRRLPCPTGRRLSLSPDVDSSHGSPGTLSCLTDAVPLLGTKRLLLSFRSGLRRCESIRISIPARFLRLLCPLLTSPTRSGSIALPSAIAGTWETSRGKTQNFPCVNAGFIKHAPFADGGLRSHVPARPERTTPHIRFLFVAPHFWIGLPPDPASRRRPCPSPNLRLRDHLVRGLSPR